MPPKTLRGRGCAPDGGDSPPMLRVAVVLTCTTPSAPLVRSPTALSGGLTAMAWVPKTLNTTVWLTETSSSVGPKVVTSVLVTPAPTVIPATFVVVTAAASRAAGVRAATTAATWALPAATTAAGGGMRWAGGTTSILPVMVGWTRQRTVYVPGLIVGESGTENVDVGAIQPLL